MAGKGNGVTCCVRPASFRVAREGNHGQVKQLELVSVDWRRRVLLASRSVRLGLATDVGLVGSTHKKTRVTLKSI